MAAAKVAASRHLTKLDEQKERGRRNEKGAPRRDNGRLRHATAKLLQAAAATIAELISPAGSWADSLGGGGGRGEEEETRMGPEKSEPLLLADNIYI